MEEHRLIGKRLESLRNLILQMGGEAQLAVARAMQAVVERNADLAAEVLAHDDEIDKLELEIDREVVEIFALLQPAARDLRFVIAVAKITPVLERIADHAGNIAASAIELFAGDSLAFVGPATADATFAGLSVTLLGVRKSQ